MNKTKLIKILEEQKQNLLELIDVSMKKQKAIIMNNSIALDELNHTDEIVLNKIQNKEKERINLILSMIKEAGLNINQLNEKTIKHFYTMLKDESTTEEFEKISQLRDELKELVVNAGMINKQNGLLVNQAGSLIKQMVSILFKSQNKPLLDRKA
ncbi:MAG: hypothetical protein Fur0015_11920 [Ignavibacteriales bacterium]